MAYNYLEAIGVGFPLVNVRCDGLPSNYNHITWESGNPLPSKETLDDWITNNPDTIPVESLDLPRLKLLLNVPTTHLAISTETVITATLVHTITSQIQPIDSDFYVPITNEQGFTVTIMKVPFVSGVATVTLSFDKSGYYQIDQESINSKLVGLFIEFPVPTVISVYE